ncbi:hypothetical protein G9C85_04485 [Halorubellus sp. JP-L1]|uniref:hypothetical protein n=1 Tax=Halorubellus sp. JP-L1 TaxID=2715753 RepID=UPI001407F4FD|nr:hypothetical protein [Halorubellus sp. JP-L1]NHN40892.1 hypothetical protein [Halorubellus sp. JP-L1]
MLPSESRLPALLAVLAIVSLAVAVPAAFPGRLGYGCGGPQGADLDQNVRGQWLVLRGGETDGGSPPVVARYDADWRELARYELEPPANATGDDEELRATALVPSEDGWWLLTADDRAYRYDRNGSFTGGESPAASVREGDDPSAAAAPEDAVDWEIEQYGDATDAERGPDANYVLAQDGTVLEYTSNWQYTGVTHAVFADIGCYGERPAWPSAWELLVASSAVGLLGLALASVLARDDLRTAALLAVGGPVLAGTFSMYLLPDAVGTVYRLPDVAIGVGLLAPVAWAAWTTRKDPVVSVPVLALSGAALVAAGVRYVLASGLL